MDYGLRGRNYTLSRIEKDLWKSENAGMKTLEKKIINNEMVSTCNQFILSPN